MVPQRSGLRITVLIGVALLLMVLPASVASAKVIDPRVATSWRAPGTSLGSPFSGDFVATADVGVAPSGDVLVLDRLANRVFRYSEAGVLEDYWGSAGTQNGEFASPRALAVDGSGNVYVADTDNNRIQTFDSDGTFVTSWGSSGTAPGKFDEPTAIDVNSSGDVYVLDFGNYRVQKFTSAGAFITSWGGAGVDDGQFIEPGDLAVAPNGNVFVTEQQTYNGWVQEFTSAGAFVAGWQGVLGHRIDVDPAGNVYLWRCCWVLDRYTPAGVPLGTWFPGPGSGGFIVDGSFRVTWDVSIRDPNTDEFHVEVQRALPASALTIKAPKSVVRGRKAVISGSLDSSHVECSGAATVSLMKGTSQLATKGTSASGAYRFSLKITKKTTVHVEFAGSTFETTGTCPAALSGNKTIKPS